MISRKLSVLAIFAIGWLPVLSTGLQTHAAVHGWLDWRGPQQNGSSAERGLPDKIELNGPHHLFTVDFPGAPTPVIANGNVYAVSSGGVLTVVKTGDEFTILHQADLGAAVQGTPAIDRDTLYVRTVDALRAFR